MKALMNEMLEAFEIFSKEQEGQGKPVSLYQPVDYIMGMGGKHMRPLLLLSAIHACGGSWQDGISAAYGVEMFHNFTLVHDDIMDAAVLRRGQPAVHKKYNTNQAILSGDVMMLRSLEYLSDSFNDGDTRALLDFVQTGVEVCEGQQMDVDFEKLSSLSIEQYLSMIKGKTAVLPAQALRLGARIAGASGEIQDLIYAFGIDLGLAFQVQDDILDAYGDPDKVGKIKGGDIRQNKKAVLYILAQSIASHEDLKRLQNWFAKDDTSDEKVEAVMVIFDKYEVKSRADELKNEYHQSSSVALERLEHLGLNCTLLNYLSQLLLNRAS